MGPAAEHNVPGYRKLNCLMLDGVIRTQVINGKRYVSESDLPAIERLLGLPGSDMAAVTAFSAAEQASA